MVTRCLAPGRKPESRTARCDLLRNTRRSTRPAPSEQRQRPQRLPRVRRDRSAMPRIAYRAPGAPEARELEGKATRAAWTSRPPASGSKLNDRLG